MGRRDPSRNDFANLSSLFFILFMRYYGIFIFLYYLWDNMRLLFRSIISKFCTPSIFAQFIECLLHY